MPSALAVAVLADMGIPATPAAAPVLSIPPVVAIAENVGRMTVEVTLSEPPAEPYRVPWRRDRARIADAALARPGVEYVQASGTLGFAAGQTRATLAVTILDDHVDDEGGYFDLLDEPPGEGEAPERRTTVSVLDDEPTPEASVADVTVAEGAGSALVPLTRPAVSLRHPVYAWRAVAGTASPADLGRAAGYASIASGETAGAIRIAVVDDDEPEGDERFEVLLAPDDRPFEPFRGTFPGPVDRASAVVTIVDDEPPAVAVVTRLRGTVRLSGRRLSGRSRAARGARVDARRGAARLAIGRRTATLRRCARGGP